MDLSSILLEGHKIRTLQRPLPKKDYAALRKQYIGLAMSLAAFHDIHATDPDHIVDIGKHIIEEDITAFFLKDEPEFVRRIEKKKREIYESVSTLHTLKSDHPKEALYPTPFPQIDLREGIYAYSTVPDQEFELQWNFALENGAPDYLPWVFELAYLLASRSVEVGDLLKTSATDTGIVVERRKGSKTNVIAWSPRLWVAYEHALELSEKRGKESPYLLTAANGEKLSYSTLQSAMARLKRKWSPPVLGIFSWTLHYLKRKGISDAKNKNIGGHRTIEMQQRYNTMMEIVKPPSY